MKIKFCSLGPGPKRRSKDTFASVSINPSFFFLKKWYELYGLNPNVNWLYPELVKLEPAKDIVEKILVEKPDVLGLGVYVWNNDLQFYIAQTVKKHLPNTIVVLGGPELSVHKEPEQDNDFFNQHPYVDYVVYGDGEKAFQQIVDYHSGYITNKQVFVNTIKNSNGRKTIYPYEILDDKLYLSQSPFVSHESLMTQIRDNLVNAGISRREQKWAIEFARGCMYSCSFCDWSQNLTKKVKRRSHDWKDDIDLFWRLDVPVRETDANFGQWPEDIKAYDYACSLYDPKRNFSFIVGNTPKLKKNITEYIIYKNCTVYNDGTHRPAISFQDTNDDVLSAIDRPTVSWDEIVKMINNLRAKLSPEVFGSIEAEMILGLPEQTIDKVVHSCITLFELGITKCRYDSWYMLSNSPGADPAYQKMWGLQIHTVYQLQTSKASITDLESTYQNLVLDGRQDNNQFYDMFHKVSFVTGHKKMSLLELWTAKIMLRKWDELNQIENTVEKYDSTQIKKIFKRLLLEAMIESKKQYNIHQQYINKYNIIVWGHYDVNQKILYEDF